MKLTKKDLEGLKEGKNVIRKDGKVKVVTVNKKPSLTDQSFKEQVDANNVIAKFKATGQVTHLAKKAGQYADCSQIQDLHQSLVQIKDAENAFSQLPAVIRKRFDNDYKQLAMFMCDEGNLDEAIALGIMEAPEGYISPEKKAEMNKAKEAPANENT
jgi:phage internal scaffolding protein